MTTSSSLAAHKRMTSVSVSDLHDSVSNLSLHGTESASKMRSLPKTFDSKYVKLEEIGRGGFSYVYRCQDIVTKVIYAVKIIDLRPFRLRDKFDPNRLRREVEIMKNLRHKNIVQFIEYFESKDEFYMVLEYCPGRELFDVILANQKLSEAEALPIFYQIASALGYLHSLNIMHRDIKPENILVLNEPDPFTGQHIIKLLDFGLSKDAGNGSAGKSFVGTPCYLAPEVEFTSKGQGGVYGLSADCWSLGALLHVMLVARFPEFERDRKGIVSLVLPPSQWAEISPQAKDLVRSLMEPNSFSRLTVREVLEHPWLGMFQSRQQQQQQLPTPPPSPPMNTLPSSLLPYVDPASGKVSEVHDFVQLYSMNDDEFKQSQRSHNPAAPAGASSRQSNHHADMAQSSVVVKMPPRNARSDEEKLADNALSLGPLLNLQRSIALCFEDALASYAEYPTVATQIHKGAVMCRKQLMDSTKMLRKVEQTASSVLDLFPDLELAVEEGAPELASDFFSVVRGWVVELRDTVVSTQLANHESMLQIHAIIHESTVGISSRQASKDSLAESSIRAATTINTDSVLENIKAMQKVAEENGGNLSTDQIFELFMTLFHSSSEEAMRSKMEEEAMAAEDKTVPELGQGEEGESREERLEGSEDVGMDDGQPLERGDSAASAESLKANSFNQIAVIGTAPSDSTAKLQEALHKLRQVDMILEQLGVFWANTEVVLDVLAKKGQHAEQFVAFAHKPKLFSRFKERLDEYSKFWMGVRDMCASYVSNVQPQADTKIRLYEFLEKESSKDTSFMSEQLYGNTFQKNSNKSSSSQNLYDADRTSNNDSGGSNRFDKVDSL